METVLELTNQKALDFFMTSENYCTLSMPKYIDFQRMLNNVRTTIRKKNFNTCLKQKGVFPSSVENVNYKMLVKKDSNYSYRPIQLSNPYLYYLLAREICSSENWKTLKERFEYFQSPNIEVASIPVVKNKKYKKQISAIVSNWWSNLEQRSIEEALNYKYMFVTDIANCYGSIYTHTIAWAIIGKDASKAEVLAGNKGNSLGNRIDQYIQSMQYGQTNGIPQGSTLFDFIAEIVLGYGDRLLADELAKLDILEYKIIRYRDDYRIFSNSKDDLERIAIILQSILGTLNFQLNPSKTHLTDSVVLDSIKKDKLFYIANIPVYRGRKSCFLSYQQELLFILSFSQTYPNSGTVVRLVNNIAHRIKQSKEIRGSVSTLISVSVEIAMHNPRAYEPVLSIVSMLVMHLKSEDDRRRMREIV